MSLFLLSEVHLENIKSQQGTLGKFAAEYISPKWWNNYLRCFSHNFLKNKLEQRKWTCCQRNIVSLLKTFHRNANVLTIHSHSTKQTHFSQKFRCHLEQHHMKYSVKRIVGERPKQNISSVCLVHGTAFLVPNISHYGYDTHKFYFDCTIFMIMHCFPAYSMKQTHIHDPSGQSLLEFPDWMISKLPTVACSEFRMTNIQTQSVLWKFSVHTKFSLNLTFTTVYFSKRVRVCLEGNLTIVESIQKLQKPGYIFCEHYASFTIYPRFPDITVIVTTFPLVSSKISFIHTVIDKSLFTSVKETYQRDPYMTPFSIILTHDNCSFMSFFIKVRKTHVVVIKYFNKTAKTLILFDGPDSLSKEIEIRQGTVHLSTFQGLLQLTLNLIQTSQAYPFKYNSRAIVRTLDLQLISENQKEYFALPSTACSKSNCLIFSSSVDRYINMSVLSFSVSRKQTDSCIFGALLTIEDFNNNIIESRPLCDNETSKSIHRRSQYSYGTNMTTLLFWYKHKCEMNVSVVFSLTSCQHVEIAQCSMHSREELQRIEKLSGMAFVRSKLVGLSVHVPPGRCLVVQFLPKDGSKLFWKCTTIFTTQVAETPGFEITHTVKGYFAAPTISRKFSFCCLKPKDCQRLEFTAAADYACVQMYDNNFCESQSYISVKHHLGKGYNLPNKFFYCYAKTYTPIDRTQFQISLNTYFSSESWMEIAVRNKGNSFHEYSQFEDMHSSTDFSFHRKQVSLLLYLCKMQFCARGG